MKEFNVTGTCIPTQHYMVDTTKKLDKIIELIEKNKYFTINRSRQYGKTTTLSSLFRMLRGKYVVLKLSFEGLGDGAFSSDRAFVITFIRQVAEFLEILEEPGELINAWKNTGDYSDSELGDYFDYLSKKVTDLCKNSKKEVLLFIDEVDKASDNQIFLHFLGMLRNKYLKRAEGLDYTFKSVILAGVYDVKNLKLKLRSDEERKYNSPWNIAADFNVDMSFSSEEISTMLVEYENDYHTGMDIKAMSEAIYFYTSGYPFLVSRLCKWIDEEGVKIWTIENIQNAEKALLKTRNTLFDDLIKNIENNADLRKLVKSLIFAGDEFAFNLANPVIDLGCVFGILKNNNGKLAVSNVIFETYLYDYFSSLEEMKEQYSKPERAQFIENGKLDMPLVLTKFQEVMKAEYRNEDAKFIEQQGRLLFLCFLKPIINGTGFYYVEPETRNSTRMDIVVVYGGEEFIIELKIWHGEEYRKKGIEQLQEYIESRSVNKGYLVSFSFNKNKDYVKGWISEAGVNKEIFEVIV